MFSSDIRFPPLKFAPKKTLPYSETWSPYGKKDVPLSDNLLKVTYNLLKTGRVVMIIEQANAITHLNSATTMRLYFCRVLAKLDASLPIPALPFTG